ncbi:uncharacterized protein TM35_000631210 [Trypanosoma theileri]|uniref:Uncharacterized protein n=1 Tax=Trypanosoma theileri TaxID=67003 RepID=A0A1X0NGA2_9TRYP|nr:uncharacterized protein TM35_000631210 [Trypanosoma theileri]ORC83621.1 hypothetical protein TM35_000631210 [Trypanosoma theileri]
MDIEHWRRALQGLLKSTSLQIQPAHLRHILQTVRLSVQHPSVSLEERIQEYQEIEKRLQILQVGHQRQLQILQEVNSNLENLVLSIETVSKDTTTGVSEEVMVNESTLERMNRVLKVATERLDNTLTSTHRI